MKLWLIVVVNLTTTITIFVMYTTLHEKSKRVKDCMANWSAICCRKLPQQKACTITKTFTKRLERDGMFMQLPARVPWDYSFLSFINFAIVAPVVGVCTQESCNDIIMMLTMCTSEWVALSTTMKWPKKNHFTPDFHVNAFFSKTQVLLSISMHTSLFMQIKLKSRVVGIYLKCTLSSYNSSSDVRLQKKLWHTL